VSALGAPPAPGGNPGPAALVVGVGCSLGCPAEEILGLVDRTLREAGADPADVVALATVDRRAGEPGVVQAAARRGWPLRTLPAPALAAVEVPTPSAVVAAHVGTPSVAEAAALLTAGATTLLVPKRRSAQATCAVAVVAPLTAPAPPPPPPPPAPAAPPHASPRGGGAAC
jgi:cobalamin biosynthesis protein CbiG